MPELTPLAKNLTTPPDNSETIALRVSVIGAANTQLAHGGDKMDLERIEKKLREARFFLDKMRDQESGAFGDKEPFDFYLSACLGAARSVDYRLTSPEQRLIEFMVIDRNVEVHESGSTRSIKTEEIKIVGDTYSDKSSTHYVSGPPGMPSASIFKPAYFFAIDGVERKATEACAEYLTLLERMLAKFKADHL